jgi:hypothetical protein
MLFCIEKSFLKICCKGTAVFSDVGYWQCGKPLHLVGKPLQTQESAGK